MLRGVAGAADRLVIDVLELLLRDVAVIALELLLGAELDAEIGELALPTLAVLARAVFAAVDGAFRAAPDVLAVAAVDLVLRRCTLGHSLFPISFKGLAPSSATRLRAADRDRKASTFVLPRVAWKIPAGPRDRRGEG